MSWFDRLKEGLSKTRENLSDKMGEILTFSKTIDDDLYDELEEIMILSDIGIATTEKTISMLKQRVREKKISDPNDVKDLLKEILVEILGTEKIGIVPPKMPAIFIVVGVNGVGKTTSIGKMAYYLKNKGYKVMLAAADTFRAGAIEQLEVWGSRANVDIVKHNEGSDPSAVILMPSNLQRPKRQIYLYAIRPGDFITRKI